MKVFFIIVSVVSSLFLFACCSEKEELILNKMELNLKNNDSIRLWCKSICSFEALEKGDYSVETENSSIAKASVYGKTFTVRTFLPGKTNIVISNNETGEKKYLKCISVSLTGYWREESELSRIYKNSLMVVANDKSISEKIKTELEAVHLNRGYEYRFVEGTNEVWITIPLQEKIKGVYYFDPEQQLLTITYNGQRETYVCDIQPPYPYIHNLYAPYAPRFILAIKQNLTEKYVEQYPNADITDVYIIRHIIALGKWWIAETNNEKTDG